jgi:[ribosomal protein S5]-alanine N-acetyltransferase
MKMIETERLILREFTAGDSDFVIELLNTGDWLRYIGNRHVNNRIQAKNFIEGRLRQSYIANSFGFYLVESKDNKIPLGMCGLVKREGLENVDLGYAFLPVHYGKGYARESSLAVLEFAEKELQLKVIDAITMSINDTSIKLLERLGFRFERNVVLNEEELMLYRRIL